MVSCLPANVRRPHRARRAIPAYRPGNFIIAPIPGTLAGSDSLTRTHP